MLRPYITSKMAFSSDYIREVAMSLIKEQQQKQLKDIFKKLENKIKLVYFTQEMECPFCKEARELLQDVSSLSDGKITLEIYDFVADKDMVNRYGIDKIPATVVEGQKDYGIRFFGIPAGYEFTSLINSILLASKGESGLSDETKELLKKLKDPVRIQVYITLTCPYCPKAVELAHRLAVESDLITGEMIETSEFPTYMQKYNIMSVPRVIINDKVDFEGTLTEKEFVENLMKVLE
jgi:glutaredoxin-like protein